MEGFGTNERILRSDVTLEETKKIEKLLRKNNISYFERWKNSSGIFKIFSSAKNAKCDLLVHMDSLELAKEIIGDSK